MTDMDIYAKSNSIVTVPGRFSNKTYRDLLNAGPGASERRRAAQALCDYLCRRTGIRGAEVRIIDRPKPCRRTGAGVVSLCGRYGLSGKVILIYNRTAVRRNPVSPRGIAGTLLHEFMHHYDMEALKLGDTIHTAGFYKRIADLQNKLR